MNIKQIFSIVAVAGIGFASCTTSADKQRAAVLEAQQNTIDSMKIEIAKQQVIDSMNEMARLQYVVPQTVEPVRQSVAAAPARSTRSKARTTRRSSSSSSTPVYTNTQPNTATQPVVYQPAPTVPAEPQKKGWSAKAKGAAIGAGVGAVTGAVIGKDNRAKGAIIGGVLGAAGGLGVGAVIDKKNGR